MTPAPEDSEETPTPIFEAPGTDESTASGPADVTVRLHWDRDLRFRAQAGKWVTELDGNAEYATSPVELLLKSVGGCAAVDVAHILRKGNAELRKLEVQVEGRRAAEHPRRLTHLSVHFHITGDVDRNAAARAARLSFDKYCSCYHSLRRDIDLDYRVTLHEGQQEE